MAKVYSPTELMESPYGETLRTQIKPLKEGDSAMFRVISQGVVRTVSHRDGKRYTRKTGPGQYGLESSFSLNIDGKSVNVNYSSQGPQLARLPSGQAVMEPVFEVVQIENGLKTVSWPDTDLYYFMMLHPRRRGNKWRGNYPKPEGYVFEDTKADKEEAFSSFEDSIKAGNLLLEMDPAALKVVAKFLKVDVNQSVKAIRHDIRLRLSDQPTKGQVTYRRFREICNDSKIPIIGHIQSAEEVGLIFYQKSLKSWYWDLERGGRPIDRIFTHDVGNDPYEALARFFEANPSEYDVLKINLGVKMGVEEGREEDDLYNDEVIVKNMVDKAIELGVIRADVNKFSWTNGYKILGYRAQKGKDMAEYSMNILYKHFGTKETFEELHKKLEKKES